MKKVAIISMFFMSFISCKGNVYDNVNATADATTDASDIQNDVNIEPNNNKYFLDGLWKITSLKLVHCELNNNWDCESYSIPGEVNGEAYTIDGFFSFEDGLNGFVSFYLILFDSSSSISDEDGSVGFYIVEEERIYVNMFDNSFMNGWLNIINKENLQITFTENGSNTKLKLEFMLKRDYGGCISRANFEVGSCYWEPTCEIPIGGCYTDELCDYLLQKMNVQGSFKDTDGNCFPY